jgi:UDP-N-acetylglucosamine 4,6-dehydratase
LTWNNTSILITGGTGSFGNAFVEHALRELRPRRLVVFSRDEVKQLEMRRRFPDDADSPIRYFIGDVRDRDRLYRAFRDVDVVVHAAALKQVPTAEYNPLEVIHTNVLGAANIIDAAIDRGVKRVIALSSDKAVSPLNLYGATKLCADKLFGSAHVYAGGQDTRFGVVRYGNVLGSRGSVIPLFRARRSEGSIPITDPRMTRFWITLDHAVRFVTHCMEVMDGSEIFVPKIPSMRIVDLARAIAPGCRHDITGIRPGEKLHEVLLTEDEARRTVEYDDLFVVHPAVSMGSNSGQRFRAGKRVPEGFEYSSDRNENWLTIDELRQMAGVDEREEDPVRAAVG